MNAGFAWGPNWVIENLWVTMIDGKAPEVQWMLEGTFVQTAQGLEPLGLPDRLQHVALWDNDSYYELSGKPIPLDLTNALASLPPRPPSSCRIRREQMQK